MTQIDNVAGEATENNSQESVAEAPTVEATETASEEANQEAPQQEKQQEAPSDKLARLERQAQRLRKQLGVEEPAPKPQAKAQSTKTNEVDLGQLGFHNSKTGSLKIETDADVDYLRDTMAETGKSQEQVLNSKWFAAELKEQRKSQTIQEAVPYGNAPRSNEPASNKVDYWVNKGQMPPNTPQNQQLRRDYVNKRTEIEKSASQFSQNPIVDA